MTDAEKTIWNRAIEAAAKAVIEAPVFPRHGKHSPAEDAARIAALDGAMKHVRKLAQS